MNLTNENGLIITSANYEFSFEIKMFTSTRT